MLTGRMLDRRYHVRSRIAHGGMATVYLATDTRLDREVALKVMHADLARDDEFVGRFIGEAKSVAQLSHQNIVAVFDQGADGEYLFLAMEYVPGRTLRALMRERGWFTWQEALGIMDPILAGLAAAHQAGIVHRDVKPENVLITPDGRVKVVDFGLARAVGRRRQHAGRPDHRVGRLHRARAGHRGGHRRQDRRLLGRHACCSRCSPGGSHTPGRPPSRWRTRTSTPTFPGSGRWSAGSSPPSSSWSARPPAGTRSGGPANADVFWRAVRSLRGLSGADESVSGAWTASGAAGAGAGAAGAGAGAAAAGTLRYGGAGFAGGDSFDGRGGGAPYGGAGMSWPGMAGAGTLEAAGGSSTTMFDGGGIRRRGNLQRNPRIRRRAGYGGGEYAATGRYDASSYHGDTLGGGSGEPGGREPFLQRWLFSRRLAYLAVAVVAVIGLGGGGWWLTSGRYTTVPSVDRTSVTAAEQELRQAGFQVQHRLERDRQRRGQERRDQHVALRPGAAGRDDRADGLAWPAHDQRAERGREVAAAGPGGAARRPG